MGGILNRYKIRILQCVSFLLSIWGIYSFNSSSLLISLATYSFLEIFAGNATLHRYYGHGSFKLSEGKKMVLTWLAHHIGVGSVLGWVGHHRWHHQYSDTPQDIHSPTQNGIFHILFGSWKVNIPRRLIRDLIKDQRLIWWHRNYFIYHACVIFGLALLSPWALVYLYAIPNTLCLCSGYLIAILPHLKGTVENSIVTEILTFGEGWHQAHHDSPDDYRFSKFDLTGLTIHHILRSK